MALDILPNCDMLMGKTHIHYYNILNFWFSTCHLRQWMCWNTVDLDYTINYFRYFKKYEICLYTYKPNHSVHDFFFQSMNLFAGEYTLPLKFKTDVKCTIEHAVFQFNKIQSYVYGNWLSHYWMLSYVYVWGLLSVEYFLINRNVATFQNTVWTVCL